MKRLWCKKSKKGITLVESILALAMLALIAVAVFSLLTTSSSSIAGSSNETLAYAEAVRKMDLVIAAISNGSDTYIDPLTGELSIEKLKATFPDGDLNGAQIAAEVSLYDTSLPQQPSNIRGWYITLADEGVIVKGFTSHTKGAFDQ